MQAVIAVGLLFMTLWLVRGRQCLSPRAPIASESPSEAERLSEMARKRELRFFMAAKILVAIQFGLILVVRLRIALGHVPSPWTAGAPWLATVLLLGVFCVYAVQAARGKKKAGARLGG
jgi:hypothetical protein